MRIKPMFPLLALTLLLSACGTAEPKTIAEIPPAEEAAEEAAAEVQAPVTELDLTGQDISALAALTEPEALETLRVNGPEISDFSVLYGLSGLRQLDARGTGMTIADYEALAAALPECEILWDIPIAGALFESDSAEITLPECSAEELELLRYFPSLKAADLSACTDDAAAFAYAQAHPELSVTYSAAVLGARYSCSAECIDLTAETDLTPESLDGLQYLPGVSVDLRGKVRTLAEMQAFADAYPEVEFRFSFVFAETSVDWSTEDLDLSRKYIGDADVVREYLRFLPNLTRLDLCRCGIGTSDMAKLREEYPRIKFIWMVSFAGEYTFRTDITAFSALRFERGYITSEDCEIFQYCTDLKALDLGHLYITDLSFLQYLPELRVLILAANRITDLTPVASLQYLTYFEVFMNEGITTLEPLSGLQYLKHLNIGRIGATDYEYLYDLPQLERLWIVHSCLTQEKQAELTAAFPNCLLYMQTDGDSCGASWRRTEVYTALNQMFQTSVYDEFFEPDFSAEPDSSAEASADEAP